MNDQRSTTDQLRDAVYILNQHGLYDAADHCRREVERVDAKLATNEAEPAGLVLAAIEGSWTGKLKATAEELDALFVRRRQDRERTHG